MLNAKGQSDATSYVKLIFQELMKKPTEQQQIFDVIWNNASLRDDLWNPTNFPPNGISKIQAKNIFISWIFDTNSPIYNFITAR